MNIAIAAYIFKIKILISDYNFTMPIPRESMYVEKDDEVGAVHVVGRQVDDARVVVELLLGEMISTVNSSTIEDEGCPSDETKNESMSFDEDDIEKRIKDIRRISENKSNCEQEDDGRFGSNVLEVAACSVDLEDRHWKRRSSVVKKRRHQSPCDFRISNVSPVQKCRKSSLCSSPAFQTTGPSGGSSPPLSASTPTLPPSIPWSVTDTVPQIFWLNTRIKNETEESFGFRNQLKSCVGSDPSFEEEVEHEASTDSEEQLDLREILKRRRRKSPRLENIESDGQSIVGIDRIKVTVEKDLTTRKVVETDLDRDNSYTDEDIELEDGEISDRTDTDLVKYKEGNSKYNKNLMSTLALAMKKKVLEHLIDMVNKEENVDELIEDNDVLESTMGSLTSLSSGQLRDYPDSEAEILDNAEELFTRKVVYRSSSPSSLTVEAHPPRNILNDFNAEMEKGMINLFPNKSKVSEDSIVKVEPVSEEDEITLSDAETVISTSSGSVIGMNASRPSLGKLSCSLCSVKVATQEVFWFFFSERQVIS